MHQTNQDQLSWSEQRSPTGKFCVHRKHLSLALGGIKDVGTWGGGHSFDVELTRVPPGAANWPLHSHAAQWELFIVLSGRGEARTPEGVKPFVAGDCLLFQPGEAHQLTNTGEADLLYYVVTDQPPADVIAYPNSKKWFVKPQRKFFRMHEVDYYEGEDGPPAA
jgi:uncharacterized cupin superfamily protein